jgi:succinoglycan biosynthesis transport protein ExoP
MNTTDQPMELAEYWSILWRRRYWFVGAFSTVLVIGVAIAFLWPPVYRSEAKILIERQAIPPDVVETTVRGYVQEQIEQLKAKITSYDHLKKLAKEFDLYPGLRDSNPAKMVSNLQDDIDVEMVDVQASSPEQQGQRVATIAFTVAFDAPTPEKAQAVTQRIADWFLEEYKAEREQQAAKVSQFLDTEADNLKATISTLEGKLAKFKQREMNQLPEMMDMNMRLYEKTEQDIAASEDAIRTLNERLDSAQAELSLTPAYKEVVDDQGNRVLTGQDRLSVLTAQYLNATARYSAEHPDVIRLSREIRALARQTGASPRTDELMQELTKLQEDLRQARQKYSEGHPEVVRLEKAVASVERGFQTALAQAGHSNTPAVPPDNPRYVALKTDIDSATADLKSQRDKLAELKEKLKDYESRLFQTPVVERDYKSLSRDYDNAQKKYSELRDKQLEASMAQQLEGGSNAERFVLVSRPTMPTSPDSPNRIGILLLSGLFAFAFGLGSVAVVEYQDKTIRSASMISDILGVPPLGVIPEMRVHALASWWSR